MLTTLVSFIFVLGVLVFIHELGHFLVAKKVGIMVEKFSLGFPPNIFSKKYGETTYCIGIIPLGGFVKMAGENPEEESTGAPEEFMSKTVGQRAAVIFAGPFMNYVLAVVLLSSVIFFSGKAIFDEHKVVIGEISDDSPAKNAGLVEDDIIIGLNGKEIGNFDSLRTSIGAFVEEEIALTYVRGNDTLSTNLVTMLAEEPNIDGSLDTVGRIGFTQKPIGYQSFGLFESIKQGFATTHELVWETIKFVKKVLFGEVSSKMLGGPIFIAQQSGQQAEKGPVSLFFFMALLSVNLAVLNVLPIPVLDGGHLVFLGIEKIKGSPVSLKARVVSQQVGLVLLFGLIIIVTYNDIVRVFTG